MQRALADPHRYLEAMDSVFARAAERQAREAPQAVSLATLRSRAPLLARTLAREVADGTYELGAAERRAIELAGKTRIIHRFGWVDRIVLTVVARALRDHTRARLLPSVYSYLPGRSAMEAVRALEHALCQREDPYVLRRDVVSYGESVPVDDAAPIWPLLESLGVPLTPLLRDCVRPKIVGVVRDGSAPCLGLPTGSPVESWIGNLYLTPLDTELASLGGFYARFGDDFVFVSPDPNEIARAEDIIERVLGSLGLRSHREKKQARLHLTRAGHADPRGLARGAAWVSYLGYAVKRGGGVRLTPPKMRRLLSDLDQRVRATAALLGDEPFDLRAKVLCEVIARALDPGDPSSTRDAEALRRVVSDRGQLRDIDDRVLEIVARAMTGIRRRRAFRTLSPRILRETFGLVSVVRQRDRARS